MKDTVLYSLAHNLVLEKVIRKELNVSHVSAQDQWADVLTKPLPLPDSFILETN
ncbi:hypothetical protein MTR_6g072500 [Medicago truncatula]|uniref:Uncharacterized protein n=1 Tax=Medicago truncatula TaxID=3880 RepID=G7KIG0_MEDTR|nr:hypothetical protein MTR_6g072500 [Medicago truncatula]